MFFVCVLVYIDMSNAPKESVSSPVLFVERGTSSASAVLQELHSSASNFGHMKASLWDTKQVLNATATNNQKLLPSWVAEQ